MLIKYMQNTLLQKIGTCLIGIIRIGNLKRISLYKLVNKDEMPAGTRTSKDSRAMRTSVRRVLSPKTRRRRGKKDLTA